MSAATMSHVGPSVRLTSYTEEAPHQPQESYPEREEDRCFRSDSRSHWVMPDDELAAIPLPAVSPRGARTQTDTQAYSRESEEACVVDLVEMAVPINGVPFLVDIEPDGTVCLQHERWSLVGCGRSLVEAEADLYQEARDLAGVLGQMPFAAMSEDLRDLRDFVFDLV